MAFDLGFFGGSDVFGGSPAPGIGTGFISGGDTFGPGGRDTGLFPQRDEDFRLPPPHLGIRPGRRFFHDAGLPNPQYEGMRPDEIEDQRLLHFARLMFLLQHQMLTEVGFIFSPPDLGATDKEQLPFKGPRIPEFSISHPKPLPRTPTHPGPILGPSEKFNRKPRRDVFI